MQIYPHQTQSCEKNSFISFDLFQHKKFIENS